MNTGVSVTHRRRTAKTLRKIRRPRSRRHHRRRAAASSRRTLEPPRNGLFNDRRRRRRRVDDVRAAPRVARRVVSHPPVVADLAAALAAAVPALYKVTDRGRAHETSVRVEGRLGAMEVWFSSFHHKVSGCVTTR